MTNLSLNPQLSGKLRGLQEAWNHESPGETLAFILDAIIHDWSIGIPDILDVSKAASVKVRLKARHAAYFEQISQLSGFTIADTVKSYLIRWLSPPPAKGQRSAPSIESSSDPARSLPESGYKRPKNRKTSSKESVNVSETALVNPPQATSKPNGRALLGGLIKQ